MFKGLVLLALAALRSIMILNGAAALALLAFLGHVVGSDKDLSRAPAIATAAAPAFTSFAVGAFLAVLATAVSYLTQVAFQELKSRPAIGATLRVAAIACAFAGLCYFGQGANRTIDVFKGSGWQKPSIADASSNAK